MTTIVLSHVEYEQTVAQTPAASQNGRELSVADKPLGFWKTEPLHGLSIIAIIARIENGELKILHSFGLMTASFELDRLPPSEDLDVYALSDLRPVENTDGHIAVAGRDDRDLVDVQLDHLIEDLFQIRRREHLLRDRSEDIADKQPAPRIGIA